MQGDATLFAREDEVEEGWRIVEPLLASGPQAEPYAAGSWGPVVAERMVERYGGWYDPPANGGDLRRPRSAEHVQGAARLAAAEVADVCRRAVTERGQAVIALSGGETPWLMLRELREYKLPWNRIYVGQVDERIAPAGDARRNRTRLDEILVRHGPLPAPRLLAMPCRGWRPGRRGGHLPAATRAATGAGTPAQLDLVQLGLGTDGHTASLVPGDPVLGVRDRDVALTGEYQGLRRMTLTYPWRCPGRARLWLVTGAAKDYALRDLLAGLGDAPAINVARDDTIVIADAQALVRR